MSTILQSYLTALHAKFKQLGAWIVDTLSNGELTDLRRDADYWHGQSEDYKDAYRQLLLQHNPELTAGQLEHLVDLAPMEVFTGLDDEAPRNTESAAHDRNA